MIDDDGERSKLFGQQQVLMVKEKEEWLLAAKALLFLLPLSIGIQAGRHRREEQARLERSVSLSYEPASPVQSVDYV